MKSTLRNLLFIIIAIAAGACSNPMTTSFVNDPHVRYAASDELIPPAATSSSTSNDQFKIFIFEPESLNITPRMMSAMGAEPCFGASRDFMRPNGTINWSLVAEDYERAPAGSLFMFGIEFDRSTPAKAVQAATKNKNAMNRLKSERPDLVAGLYDPVWHQGVQCLTQSITDDGRLTGDDLLAGLCNPPGDVLMSSIYGFERIIMRGKIACSLDLRFGRKVYVIINPWNSDGVLFTEAEITSAIQDARNIGGYFDRDARIDGVIIWHSMDSTNRNAVIECAGFIRDLISLN